MTFPEWLLKKRAIQEQEDAERLAWQKRKHEAKKAKKKAQEKALAYRQACERLYDTDRW